MKKRIFINFLKSEKELRGKEKKLFRKVIEKHSQKASLLLDLDFVNVTIYSNKNFAIPETGEGGYSVSKEWFHLYIDPTRKTSELQKIIEKVIPGTIYHEMNHVARWGTTGYGESLVDAIITEGMASVFAKEFWGEGGDPWTEYTEDEIYKLVEIAKKEGFTKKKGYDHDEWFYGAGELPRWIGYKLGFYFLTIFRDKNPEMEWNEIVKMTSKEIIDSIGKEL